MPTDNNIGAAQCFRPCGEIRRMSRLAFSRELLTVHQTVEPQDTLSKVARRHVSRTCTTALTCCAAETSGSIVAGRHSQNQARSIKTFMLSNHAARALGGKLHANRLNSVGGSGLSFTSYSMDVLTLHRRRK
jgi:hypothetical protein